MNPYEILNVPKNFTLEQLKDSYKRIALKVHPDKGGSEHLFLLVTKCFKKLLQEFHKRQADRQFNELKAAFHKDAQQFQPSMHTATTSSRSYTHAHTNNSTHQESPRPSTKFDVNRFNKVFDENRLENAHDKGYGTWVTEEAPEAPRPKQRFKLETFNKTFDEQARIDNSNKYIIKYKEPEALITSKKIAFTELGEDDIDDFSGDNMSKKNLNYMDYKVAHTTTKIVDPSLIKNVKTYKNVNELEAARSKVSYEMDDITKEEYEYRQNLERSREQRRIRALQEQERMIQQQYERVNQMFLGNRPSFR